MIGLASGEANGFNQLCIRFDSVNERLAIGGGRFAIGGGLANDAWRLEAGGGQRTVFELWWRKIKKNARQTTAWLRITGDVCIADGEWSMYGNH